MINVVVVVVFFKKFRAGQAAYKTNSRRVWARLQLTRPRNVMLITSYRKYALANIFYVSERGKC